MPKQQFQALFFIIKMMVYLAWLLYIQWWHASLLLFHRSNLDQRPKGLNNQMEDQISLSYDFIKPNSLKKVHDASFCRTFSLFPRSYQNVAIDRMKDQVSLSSQTHWRRTFSLFPHSWQNMATKWGWKGTPRGRIISRQSSRRIHIHSFNP